MCIKRAWAGDVGVYVVEQHSTAHHTVVFAVNLLPSRCVDAWAGQAKPRGAEEDAQYPNVLHLMVNYT